LRRSSQKYNAVPQRRRRWLNFLGDNLQILFPRNRMALTENGKTRTANNLKEQFLAVFMSKSQILSRANKRNINSR